MANQAAVNLHTRPGTEVILDYDAHIIHWEMAGVAGLEPVTSAVTGQRSNQLS